MGEAYQIDWPKQANEAREVYQIVLPLGKFMLGKFQWDIHSKKGCSPTLLKYNLKLGDEAA